MRGNGFKLNGMRLTIEGERPRRYQSLKLSIPHIRQNTIIVNQTPLLSTRKFPNDPLIQSIDTCRNRSQLPVLEIANGRSSLVERGNSLVVSSRGTAIKSSVPALSLASIRLPQIAAHSAEQRVDQEQEERANYEAPQRPLNETITILCNMQELYKLLKLRLEDVIALEKHVNFKGKNLKSALQFVDKVVLDVETRESTRETLETKKIAAIEGLRTDDKDTRKAVAKAMKKILGEFEKRYFFKAPARVTSVGEHVKEVMSGESPSSEPNVSISHNKLLATALRYAFSEKKSEPQFIFQVCTLHTRLILKQSLKTIIEMYNKEAVNSLRRRWVRQIPTTVLCKGIERTKQQCNELCKYKIITALKKSNRRIYKGIRTYIEDRKNSKI
eukprot:TRINITY_DN12732_c1_g1_i1.p1 TRINITY_DN12732_c1_g1~~TRINITY_DN12732_c1_g1_i1.p1  ORF type:complete len:397 (+),score=63.51 TRINITY_DN12732_c1_g1_i1:34-1191(+)